jgi:hypothetical protein
VLIRIALLLVSIPLLAHGADGLYHGFRSRAQAHVTCEQFRRERPASGWLHLTGCEIDYVRAGYRDTRGRVTELFFPLRPVGSSPAQPSALVVATRDPALLAIVERAIAGPAQQDQEAFLVMMLQVVTAMGAAHEVEGLTRSALEMLRVRAGLGAIKAPLDQHFKVLDFHRRPRLLFPAIEAILGAQGLFLLMFLLTARRRQSSAPELHPEEDVPMVAPGQQVDATTPAAEVTEVTAVPAESPGLTAAESPSPVPETTRGADDRRRPAPARDFRRLMLVNLPPNASPAALEGAPPLGPNSAVRSALSRVLPGLAFNLDGVGQFNRPDHAIVVDPGTAPEVWTATIDVTGEAAGPALKNLVTQTGWQVYAPRLGRFLTSEDLEP